MSAEERGSSESEKTIGGLPYTRSQAQALPLPSPRRPTREATVDPNPNSPCIPPDHHHRTLVLCFDGTGDQFDDDNSNIVQLFSLLKKDEKDKQAVYYQTGIGTYTTPNLATPLTRRISKTLDVMFASNLDAHVIDGYEFLMQNYSKGDRICLFGFSRGAYTARSLAGMIHKVGLLPANNFEQVPFAYKMYTRADELGWQQSNAFKKSFSINVGIEFIGVWDTVNAVGFLPKRLPFTTSNNMVRTFRHAVALDERRAKFKANLWNRPTEAEEVLGITPVDSREASPGPQPIKILNDKKQRASPKRSAFSFETSPEDEKNLDAFESTYSAKRSRPTDVKEVWFAGCHADVGGGSVANNTRYSLARISLRWMVRECFMCDTGIMFTTDGLRELGMDPMSLYPFVTPRPSNECPPNSCIRPIVPKGPSPSGFRSRASLRLSKVASTFTFGSRKPNSHLECSRGVVQAMSPPPAAEEQEEVEDALSPLYDQLKIKRGWWLLEVFPMEFRYQKGGTDEWTSRFTMNRARHRIIPNQTKGVLVHRSVKMRMESSKHESGKKYVPKAKFKVEHAIWVD